MKEGLIRNNLNIIKQKIYQKSDINKNSKIAKEAKKIV